MKKLCNFIVKYRRQIGIVFMLLTILSLILMQEVTINYDLSSYIPDDSPSKQALDITKEEFGMQSSARIMVNNVSLVEAKEYKDKISAIDGVYMVSWLDDSYDVYQPESFIDKVELEKYYKDGSALFDVMFDEDDYSEKTDEALTKIYEILPDDANLMGSAVDTKSTRNSIQSEMIVIMAILVPLAIVILILTTDSYFSCLIFILVIGVSIILNLGTNIIFDSVSFLTYSISAALQFAVSMDYSVFMLHQFEEEKEKNPDTIEAMKAAVHNAIKSIFSSSLTTVVGFLALAFMSFGIGKDIGFVFAKGIVFSLLCVILLMPFLILTFHKQIEKTKHKKLLPTFEKFAKGTTKIGGVLIALTLILVIPCFVAQNENHFLYGVAAFGSSEGTKAYEDEQKIIEKFGRSNPILLLVPNESYYTEKLLVNEIEDLETVDKVLTLVNVVPEGVPYDFIDKDLYEKFQNENYTRIIVYVKTASESELATATLINIQNIASKYYRDTWKCTGTIPVTLDMKASIESDYNRVNRISIISILVILIFTFKSLLVPIILTLVIEAGIFINMAIPYFSDTSLIFMGYLIVSSIELGATIDYAILMTNNYLNIRKEKSKKESIVESIKESLPSIIISGAILIAAGYIIKYCSSLTAVSDMGELIGRGALISVILVVVVLPQILALFDKFIVKNKGKGLKNKKEKTEDSKSKEESRKVKVEIKKNFMREMLQKIRGNLKKEMFGFKKVSKMNKKRIVAISLLGVFMGNNVFATENIIRKSETVYVNTDAYGMVDKINVYNDYSIYNQDKIIEYGNYNTFQVLTGNINPIVSGDMLEWDVSGDTRLSYIGELSNDKSTLLPWNFELKYSLNGVEMPASELPGKNGMVKVEIKVISNEKAPEYYRNNYMLEITSSFDMTKYLSVYAKDATEITVGNTKQLMFIVLPGQEKTIQIEVGSEDFAMDGLTFAMVPLEGEILETIENLANDKNDMEDAFEQTNKSMDVILNQMSKMTNDITTIVNGTEGVQGGLNSIHSDSEIRNQNIEELKNSLNEINLLVNNVLVDITYVKSRVTDTAESIEKINVLIKELSENLDDFEDELDDLIDMAEDLPGDIANLKNVVLDTKNLLGSLKKLLGDYDAVGDIDINAVVKSLKTIGSNTEEMGEEAYLKLMSGEGDATFYQEVLKTSQEIGENLETIQTELEKAEDLMTDGNEDVSDMNSDITKLQKDLNRLANSLDNLEENSEDLPDSIGTMQDLVKNMNEIIKIINDSIDKNLSGDTEKIYGALENTENIVVQLQTIQNTAQSMIAILQNELKILDNEIHNSTNQTIDGTQQLLKEFGAITKESEALKSSKNIIYNAIKTNINDIENETTLFNVDSEAEIKSFVSEKNDVPEKVQILVKTASIKKSETKNISDLETKQPKVSFIDKIKHIFVKIWNFFAGLFN